VSSSVPARMMLAPAMAAGSEVIVEPQFGQKRCVTC
jgi:hypothetical protein